MYKEKKGKDIMPKKACSFCGRSENEVKLLITGINGFICEECAKQAFEIVQQTGVLLSLIHI